MLTNRIAGLTGGRRSLPPYKGEWPSPRFQSFSRPAGPYVLLHVGASRDAQTLVAGSLASTGQRAGVDRGVWSSGPVGPGGKNCSTKLRSKACAMRAILISQLWHLVAGAQAVICPDTGIAHLARVIGRTAACVLVGPADSAIVGNGRFWSNMPCRWLNASVGCRSQPYASLIVHHLVGSCRRAGF